MGAMEHPHVAEKHYRYSRARSLLHLAPQFHKRMGTIIWYRNRSGFREYDDVLFCGSRSVGRAGKQCRQRPMLSKPLDYRTSKKAAE